MFLPRFPYDIPYVFHLFSIKPWAFSRAGLRNVTISTVGVPGRIRALGHEIPAGPNLALSLHAPTQERAMAARGVNIVFLSYIWPYGYNSIYIYIYIYTCAYYTYYIYLYLYVCMYTGFI